MTDLSPQPPPAPAAPVDHEHTIHLLHEMLRIRRFEEKCAELYPDRQVSREFFAAPVSGHNGLLWMPAALRV